MKNTQKTIIGLLCLTFLVAGCGSQQAVVVPTTVEPEPLVFTSSTSVAEKPTTTVRVGSMVLSVETVVGENGLIKNYTLKKDGSVWKTLEAGFGESGIHVFKQTKQFVYLAPEIDGLGGYILYEALPTRVIRVDLKTGDQKIFQVGGVLEDVSDDDKQMLWVVAGQGSLSFAVYDTTTGKRTLTIPVEKKFSQAGNARFSPDMKKFAYAATLGIPDREGGVIMSVDIAKKQQTKLIEDLHSNKVPRVYGWRTASIVDYRFE